MALAATSGDMPASTTKDGCRGGGGGGGVTHMSYASEALPSQLETKMSAGLVYDLSSPQPHPTLR